MRKLLVVPVTVMTVALVAAFLMPAAASGAVQTVLPGVRAGVKLVAPGILTGAVGFAAGSKGTPSVGSQAKPVDVFQANQPLNGTVSGAQSSSLPGTSEISNRPLDRGHGVATAGRMNCGRFGNGFHGGKHDFTCPNQPFPAAAS